MYTKPDIIQLELSFSHKYMYDNYPPHTVISSHPRVSSVSQWLTYGAAAAAEAPPLSAHVFQV